MLNIDDILTITSDTQFEIAALELFRFQARMCEPYRQYVELMGIVPENVYEIGQIPYLPIEFFKSKKVYSGTATPEKIFTSSTTGGDVPAKHYMARVTDYEKTFRKAFSCFYGEPENWSFYALLPCYLEREGSSLVYMADDLIRLGGGGFFLNNYEELIKRIEEDRKPKILLGVSYALWDLAEQYAPKLTDTIVMETGGMKGRREELSKNEFHKILTAAFGVEKIDSEYGMAELTSQAYSTGDGIFRCPSWMRVFARDLNDPTEILPADRTGGINIIDLANINSCAFIQTQDMGRVYADGSFSILGRIANSDIRGCNLLIQ